MSCNEENESLARLELIASVLRMPDGEIDEARSGERNLIEYARRYGQSLDQIVDGDVRGLILKASRRTWPS